jgi:hypothetical protein
MIEDEVLSAFTELMDLVVVGVQLSLKEDTSFAIILFLLVLVTFEVRKSARVFLGLVVFIIKLLLGAQLYSAGVNAYNWLPFRLIMVLSHVHILSFPQIAVVFAPRVSGMGKKRVFSLWLLFGLHIQLVQSPLLIFLV